MKKSIFTILFFGIIYSGLTQNIVRSKKMSTSLDEIIETGMEKSSTEYLFIKRFGIFKDTLNWNGQMPFHDVTYYHTEILLTDNEFNIIDSSVFYIPDYYTIAKQIFIINDTIVVVGKAVKNDFTVGQVFISTFTSDFIPIKTSLLMNDTINRIYMNAVVNNNNEIVCNITNNFYDNGNLHQGFIVTNTKENIVNYVLDSNTQYHYFIHFDKTKNQYQLFDNYYAIYYDNNFQKINEIPMKYPTLFFGSKVGKDVYDTSFLTIGAVHFLNPYLYLDICYYLLDNNMNIIDSNYIFIPDTLDQPANADYYHPDTLFLGGTVNTNWNISLPPEFQQEDHKIILQCSNLKTDEIYWTKRYGGDGNYMMHNLFATSDNKCVVMGTWYDWQNNPVQERDIVLLKIDGNGVVTNSYNSHNIHELQYSIYPNPGSNTINIKNYNQTNITIFKLFDLTGKVVMKKQFTGETLIINSSMLPKGIYIYRITGKNLLCETGKWVKK